MSEAKLEPANVLALQRQYRFQYEEAQQSWVLLYPEGLIKLQGSAGEIMKRIDGKRTVDEIIGDLTQAFPGVDLRQDVMEFLEAAYARGWIRTK